MSDGILTRHAHLNTGAMAVSMEELAQKHQELFQKHSQLKAQHVVLKKAVIKEQTNNAALHGSVKEKEKELRKLQEQLDLLVFHNERLTKRIDTFQDEDTKGSHFSLLGGAVKKELEKSTQALDAANQDLAKKIEENERLYEELSEVNHIYTNHVNGLHAQMGDLEKQMQEKQLEISSLQSEKRHQQNTLQQDHATLQSQVDTLQNELTEKTQLLKENESRMRQSDVHLLSEIKSLRGLLLAKVGDIEDREPQETFKGSTLSDVIPACEALQILEEQANNYIYALREKTSLKGLPHVIAQKLKTSSETWSEQVKRLAAALEDSEARVKVLLQEKSVYDQKATEQEAKRAEWEAKQTQQEAKQAELETKQVEQQNKQAEQKEEIDKLRETIEDLQQQLQNQETLELIKSLEAENHALEIHNQQLKEELETIQAQKLTQESTKESTKETVDRETQIDKELITEPASSQEPLHEESTENAPLSPMKSSPADEKHELSSSDEDEEVFIYKGKDAQEPPTLIDDTVAPVEIMVPAVSPLLDTTSQSLSYSTPVIASIAVASSGNVNTKDNASSSSNTGMTDAILPALPISRQNSVLAIEEDMYPPENDSIELRNEMPGNSNDEQPSNPMPSLEINPQPKQVQVQTQDTNTTCDYNPNESMAAKEATLKNYYEIQMKQLTEKLQLVDSRVVRYYRMVETLREKLSTDDKDKQALQNEVKWLRSEVDKAKEMLATTESNYQGQVDMMTEYITTLQQSQSKVSH
ncbi:hypothetical protein BDF14DRAFT_1834080 [Spinellus fusiger]|nr:hypothetical protein BDF14DRAFT_1834080 [Spinellus fusiger]